MLFFELITKATATIGLLSLNVVRLLSFFPLHFPNNHELAVCRRALRERVNAATCPSGRAHHWDLQFVQ